MIDLNKTQECPVFDPAADEITLRERCVSMRNLDGSMSLLKIDPPILPAADQHKKTLQDAASGQTSVELKYKISPAFDIFLLQLFEKYGEEYQQTMYRGLAEHEVEIHVAMDINQNGSNVRGYQLVCKSASGPIVITPITQHWNAFLDMTEKQIKNLCELHIRRKREQKRLSQQQLAAQVAPNNHVSLSVSKTLISARLTE